MQNVICSSELSLLNQMQGMIIACLHEMLQASYCRLGFVPVHVYPYLQIYTIIAILFTFLYRYYRFYYLSAFFGYVPCLLMGHTSFGRCWGSGTGIRIGSKVLPLSQPFVLLHDMMHLFIFKLFPIK